ncbi:MAG: protein kinase [Blastochloris sp.]|nr:protein kinase [Blastochloris sp.]
MGEVWQAHDPFGNPVAIKMLLTGEAATENQLRRFKQEARILSKLPHRNICRIHEVGEYDGRSYLAMECIDGFPLDEIISHTESSQNTLDATDLSSLIQTLRSQSSPIPTGIEGELIRSSPLPSSQPGARVLPVQQTLAIITRVCDAIHYAHQHGVLHRDIKPGNIMIRSDGEPVVMDFGLAKFEQKDTDEPNSQASLGVRSMTGMTLGTIDFMAPEQAVSSKDVDERADVYSLGAVLYRLLTGHPHYYVTGHLLNDAQKLQSHEPIPPSIHKKQIDPDLEIITLKALRSDPSERYRSVAAFKDDLERYQRGEIIQARPVTLREITGKWIKRNRSVFFAVVSSLLTIFLILSASVVILNQRRLEAERLRVTAETNEQAARANEARALAARQEADAAVRDLQEQEAQNQALLAKYEAEFKARGEIQLKLTEAEKQRAEAEAKQRSLTHRAQNVRDRLEEAAALRRIRLEMQSNQWQGAYDLVERSRQRHPEMAELWLLKARLHAAVFQLDQVLSALESHHKLSPNEAQGSLFLEQQTLEFHSVTKDLPGQALEDRELQNAYARRLQQSSNPEDHWPGLFLSNNEPLTLLGKSKP